MPILEQAAEAGDVRFVIVMRDFDGISGDALWQDMKVGIEHLRSWKRIALVTDIDRMTHATDLFGWMTPGEKKTFSLPNSIRRPNGSQKDDALSTVALIDNDLGTVLGDTFGAPRGCSGHLEDKMSRTGQTA